MQPGRNNYNGQGICIPVDVETKDGKVTTVGWDNGVATDHDKATAGWSTARETAQKAYAGVCKSDYKRASYVLPSVTVELECSATKMFASAAAAAAAVYSLI